MSAIFQLKVNVSQLCQRKKTGNCLVYLEMTERRHAKQRLKIKKTDGERLKESLGRLQGFWSPAANCLKNFGDILGAFPPCLQISFFI